MIRVFAINLGSTSTKWAYHEDGQAASEGAISYHTAQIEQFESPLDQREMRTADILAAMDEHGIKLDELDAFVSRGGLTEPVPGGVIEINEAMVEQAESGNWGVHPCNVGVRIAFDLVKGRKARALVVDSPATDELSNVARYSGLPGVERVAHSQALNNKAMARVYAEEQGRSFADMNFVCACLGGGISVVAFERGRMIEAPDGVDGEGCFSTNRSGGVTLGPIIRMCYSGAYTMDEMFKKINGKAGLVGYLDTVDARKVEAMIDAGDEYAAEVLDAMCYQVAKDIGGCAVALAGDVDAIIVTGGMAHSARIFAAIERRVKFSEPVVCMPGEREMESLCHNAYEALLGKQEIQQFVPST